MNNLDIDKKFEEYKRDIGNYKKLTFSYNVLIMILMIFFILCGISAFGQISNLEVKNIYIKQKIATTIPMIYSGDSVIISHNADSVNFWTNQFIYKFDKSIKAPMFYIESDSVATRAYTREIAAGGGTLLRSGMLYWNQDSLSYWPYADKGSTFRNDQPYYDSNITVDTSFRANSIDNIGIYGSSVTTSGVYGISTDGTGTTGVSTNSYGGYLGSTNGIGSFIYSTNSLGVWIYTINGYNNALFGASDSFAIHNNCSWSWYNGGNYLMNTQEYGGSPFLFIVSPEEGTTQISPTAIQIVNNYEWHDAEINPYSVWQLSGGDSTQFIIRRTNQIDSRYFAITYNNEIIYRDLTDTLVRIDSTGDLHYNFSHGSAITTVATYTPALDVNVPKKLEPAITATYEDYITIDGDSITITRNGDYWFRIYGNISSTANDDFRIQIAKNAVLVDSYNYWQGSTNGASNYSPIAFEWYMADLIIGDDVSFWITNNTNSNDPVIRNFKVIVTKSPE